MLLDVQYLISLPRCLYLPEVEREEIILILFFVSRPALLHLPHKLRNVGFLVLLFIVLFSLKN